MRLQPVSIAVCVLAASLGTSAPVAAQSEERAVLAAVQAFLDAMHASDAAASRAVMLPDGQYFAVRDDADGRFVRRVAHEAYFAMLEANRDVLLERIWEPTVLVHRTIAVVWTPYDIYRNGAFMHCGVDAFSLVRTDDGWRIASIVYTVEPVGCEPSPLGALGPPPGTPAQPLRLVPAAERAARGAQRDEVVVPVQAFAAAMAANDVAASRRVLLTEGQGYATTTLENGSVRITLETNEAYLDWLATNTAPTVERIFDETALVHGPIAVVWAPYDFHVDGAFSHCGINAISLIRTDAGWQTADWVWTVERHGCEQLRP
jgi:ketosteroid isomerase-like protein